VRTAGAIALLTLAAAFVPAQWLRYDRGAILGGQVWRLFTCHVVHLGWAHLALNVAALLALGFLFGKDVRRPAVWIAAACAVSLGILLLRPRIEYYVGLSGVLHGLFAAAAVRRPWLFLPLALKLGYEQAFGPLTGGNVLVDAHLFGAVGGFAAAAVGFLHPPLSQSGQET